MKFRLTAPGFETYTGQMGVIFFENGLSVSDVLPVDAVRIAGVIGGEWEDGAPANVSQLYLDNAHTPAPNDDEQRAAATVTNDTPRSNDFDAAAQVAAEVGVSYTEEELARIADERGIAGLREIAEPLGLKGNSISGLMQAILRAAGAKG